MHRIDHSTAAPGNLFTEGDPLGATPATVVTADWLNALQEEIASVVEGAGLSLDKPDNTQLLDAINALIAGYTFTVADGSITTAKLAAVLDLSGKTLTLSAAQKAVDYLEYRDEKASGTDGGGCTAGSWQTRTINTEKADAGGHGSLASNQITLAAGTYECEIVCPAVGVNGHQARLRNVTDGATVLLGTSSWAGNGSSQCGTSIITGRFTIAAGKALEVQHRSSGTRNVDGFGVASAFGDGEVYTVARFWKVG